MQERKKRSLILSMVDTLFTYGSLMCRDVMQMVVKVCPRHMGATLEGFQRYTLTGETFPGLVRSEAAAVSGILYFDINPVMWQCLDRFEGDFYRRESHTVLSEDNVKYTACVYVMKEKWHHLLTTSVWDFSYFLQYDKAHFMAACAEKK